MSDNNKEKGTGIKFDGEKIRWDLLPIEPVESIIRVMMLGSKKYGDYNWQRVPESRRRYYAAALRHLTAWWQGEKIDPESGESHLAHAMCCLMFLQWHEMHKVQPDFQDKGMKEAYEDVENFHGDRNTKAKPNMFEGLKIPEPTEEQKKIVEDAVTEIKKFVRGL